MRIRNAVLALGASYAATTVGACGSLDDGAIHIIDPQGGTGTSTGGNFLGRGGASAGRRAGGGIGNGAAGTDVGGQAGAGIPTEGGSAGTPSSGGAGGVEGGASGVEGGAGGAGEATGCTRGSDCVGTTPICAMGGQCRACANATECAADDAKTPFCRMGSCVGCLVNRDCPAATPVCGSDFQCRTCVEGSECGTLACTAKGSCAIAAQTVYALAQTGSTGAACGSLTAPCYSLGVAAGKLSALRPYLVLIATQSSFNEGATLPANVDVTVFGNHVKVAPYDGSIGFILNGGNVTLDDVVVAATAPAMSGGTSAAISCTGGGKVKMRKGAISNAATSYGSAGLLLSKCNADVQESTFTGSQTGIVSTCSAPSCPTPSQSLTVERSLFKGNKNAIAFDGGTFLIRNNLFIKNGNTSYVDIIGLRGTSGIFSYNTMVGNENNCSYEGGLVSCEGGAAACGTFSSNLSWGNMLNPTAVPPQPCPDQVYYSPPPLTNSLSETTWPGTGNISANPKFVDAAKENYAPGPGSPALDKGSAASGVLPDVDYYGTPRSRTTPDIGAIEVP